MEKHGVSSTTSIGIAQKRLSKLVNVAKAVDQSARGFRSLYQTASRTSGVVASRVLIAFLALVQ